MRGYTAFSDMKRCFLDWMWQELVPGKRKRPAVCGNTADGQPLLIDFARLRCLDGLCGKQALERAVWGN
ncbi:hypothetical protein D7X33_24570 [Butyricicoccus sp. 1XD8-22]|nr:hypothetical protein D7X33_24570 [Butyricicoccus sp. 1XD8-22]